MSYKYRQCPTCFELSTAEQLVCPFCRAGLEQVNYHPWRRFFARWVDMVFALSVWSLLLICLLAGLDLTPEEITVFQRWAMHLDHPILSYSLLGIIFVFTEAMLLSIFGNTPGKKLYRIRLDYTKSDKLPFRVALKRTFMMWTVGMALGIPLISLYACFLARKRLIRTGVTLWDAEGDFHVSHRPWSIWYGFWVLLASGAVISLIIILSGGSG